MRTVIIILVGLVIVFFIVQHFIAKSTNNTESHNFVVVKDYGEFEIRRYDPALFSYTVMQSNSYETNSSKGFRRLAGYIFGGNDKEQKIAMTTPVEMTMADSMTMKFKIPDGMELEDLPKPNDSDVQFERVPEKTVAAIQFDGWASDEKIDEYTQLLSDLLDQNDIAHTGNYSFLGYNPPYQLTGRRNEVIVELK